MVEQTIRDAAERVGRVPVAEVFNRRRLRILWAVTENLVMTPRLPTFLLLDREWSRLRPHQARSIQFRKKRINSLTCKKLSRRARVC